MVMVVEGLHKSLPTVALSVVSHFINSSYKIGKKDHLLAFLKEETKEAPSIASGGTGFDQTLHNHGL